MAAIKHGIYVYEQPTALVAPVIADSAVQVAIGTAPVNLGTAVDPLAVQIAYSYDEAVNKLGYSSDLTAYTLCQIIKASFEIYAVAPIVLINVLDPSRHKKSAPQESFLVEDRKAIFNQKGILAKSLVVTADGESLSAGVDYTVHFEPDGAMVVDFETDLSVTDLSASYDYLDPSMVTDNDVLAGIRKISEVYPKLGITPGQLLCPGWSQKPEIYAALTAKTEGLNGLFRSLALADLDPVQAVSYDKCGAVKNQMGITNIHSVAVWPMARVGDHIMWMSALLGAHMAYVDYLNEGVPYVSPSNKALKISGICGIDGGEIILDMDQANLLNGQGICTAINMNGWRFWGNYTAGYPGTSDVKDVFIPVRRMFSWWGNSFILTYFQKVDSPMNRRLIEAVVDSENIRANGFKARFQLADARIEYREADNPQTDLLGGTIRFHQYLTPYPPAQAIINTLEFDPQALADSLAG